MIDVKRIKEAESNVRKYIEDSLLKKEKNETARNMYIRNSELSLKTAQKLTEMESKDYKPYLWVIVTSYYSMFYIANAVLLNLGYRVGDKIAHQVTEDSLIVHVRNKLRKELLEEYEEAKEEALEIISSRVDSIIESFELERKKRSIFQYQMDEEVKKSKAETSLERAKEFVFEIKKLLK